MQLLLYQGCLQGCLQRAAGWERGGRGGEEAGGDDGGVVLVAGGFRRVPVHEAPAERLAAAAAAVVGRVPSLFILGGCAPWAVRRCRAAQGSARASAPSSFSSSWGRPAGPCGSRHGPADSVYVNWFRRFV